MPELPEVETTRRGIAPHLLKQKITDVIVRNHQLRWPVPDDLSKILKTQSINSVDRRAKYLLLHTDSGVILLHLGMSGRLRILPSAAPVQKHDHVDIRLATDQCLRFTDPRRFGALLWTDQPLQQHPLLQNLGPEPLSAEFSADYLYARARGRRSPVKTFIMDAHIVVGIGNIYASEALHIAGIHPARAAGRIALARYRNLVDAIRGVLLDAIKQGGTTLRDFVGSTGEAGYFQQYLHVYGRGKQPCHRCGNPIQMTRLGQRSTYFCNRCQR